MKDSDHPPNYYGIIPATVRYDERLNPAVKVMFAEVTALSNKYGYCHASNTYFSTLYSCSHRSVTRWIKQLEEYGYIRIDFSQTQRKIYPLIDPLFGTPLDKNNEKERGGVDKNTDHPLDKDMSTPPLDKNVYPPLDKNVYPPLDKNVYHNNTSSNNTRLNNTREREAFKIDATSKEEQPQETTSKNLSPQHSIYCKYFHKPLTAGPLRYLDEITDLALLTQACQHLEAQGNEKGNIGTIKNVMREIKTRGPVQPKDTRPSWDRPRQDKFSDMKFVEGLVQKELDQVTDEDRLAKFKLAKVKINKVNMSSERRRDTLQVVAESFGLEWYEELLI